MEAIILGAGKGSRMKDSIPKWAQLLDERMLIDYLAHTLQSLQIKFSVCIKKAMEADMKYPYFFQNEFFYESFGPIYSANFSDDEEYLVLNADMPLIDKDILESFIGEFSETDREVGILVSKKVRNKKNYQRVNRKLKFNRGQYYNLGVYLFKGSFLNCFKERFYNYYGLTLPKFIEDTVNTSYIKEIKDSTSFININEREDLKEAHTILASIISSRLLTKNRIMANNIKVDFFSKVEGNTIYDNAKIVNSIVYNSWIKENTHILNSQIDSNNYLGPFLKIEDSSLDRNNEIGSFVEIKRSQVGAFNQIKHHTYLGDTTLGNRNNIGAMTVVSNFNGAYKNKTEIGNDNFIGSFTNLVSPLKMGSNNYIASMTKVVEEVYDNQFIKENHQNIIKDNTFLKP